MGGIAKVKTLGGNSARIRLPGWLKWLDRVLAKTFLYQGSKLMAWISGVLILVVILITIVDVVTRGTPLVSPWGTGGFELTELFMTQLSCLGWIWTWYAGGHVRIELVLSRAYPRVKAILGALTCSLGIFWFSLTTWALAKVVISSMHMGSATDALEIPLWPFQLVLMIVFGVFSLALLRSLASYIAKVFGHSVEPWTIDIRDAKTSNT